jgi:hypothetical protein
MVTHVAGTHFASLIDDFLSARPLTGPHAAALATQLKTRADELLNAPDVRYMPVFKVLDLVAALATLAEAIDREAQLRANEARALLREALCDTTPLIQQFRLDAALERARYEPLMLSGKGDREQLLRHRWQAMRAAQGQHDSLPEAWLCAVDAAVDAAIAAPAFRSFRPGPLMQLFAEMLAEASRLQRQRASLETLTAALAPDAPLWKRYALKQKRYRQKPRADFPDLPTPNILH